MAITTANTIKFSDVCQELYGNSNTNGKSLISGAHGSAVQANFVPGYDTYGASKTLLDFRGYANIVSYGFVVTAGSSGGFKGYHQASGFGSITPNPANFPPGRIVAAYITSGGQFIIEIFNDSNTVPPNGWGSVKLDTNGPTFIRTNTTIPPYTTSYNKTWAYQFDFPVPYSGTNVFLTGSYTSITVYEASGGGGGVGDTTAPTVPTGLAAQSITATGFTLTWNASTDNVGIAGYKVYKNGVLHVTTQGTPASYIVSGQTASTNATWTVSAYDAAGNNSAQSSGLSVTQAASQGNRTQVWGYHDDPCGTEIMDLWSDDASGKYYNSQSGSTYWTGTVYSYSHQNGFDYYWYVYSISNGYMQYSHETSSGCAPLADQ